MPITTEQLKADFCLKIDFEKDSHDPARVFKAAAALIDSLTFFDKVLIDSIEARIEPVLLLEDVEIGSLKIWLKALLENVPDESLQNLEWQPILGQYLAKAKYIAIDFLNQKTHITTASDLDALEMALLQAATETEAKWLPHYAKVPKKGLLQSAQKISAALKPLSDKDKVSLISDTQELPFNFSLDISPESIEDILTAKSLDSDNTMILKIKKPDYLGESQWEFRHGKQAIFALITDEAWLTRFQNRELDVRPGDSLVTKVRITVNYGSDNEVIGTHYEVTEVLSVEPVETYHQLKMQTRKTDGEN